MSTRECFVQRLISFDQNTGIQSINLTRFPYWLSQSNAVHPHRQHRNHFGHNLLRALRWVDCSVMFQFKLWLSDAYLSKADDFYFSTTRVSLDHVLAVAISLHLPWRRSQSLLTFRINSFCRLVLQWMRAWKKKRICYILLHIIYGLGSYMLLHRSTSIATGSNSPLSHSWRAERDTNLTWCSMGVDKKGSRILIIWCSD